ncbi:MAG: YiiX/YebB-like N1pC/P60 family cysteine hydrolase [Bacteroidota bacterium]
MTLQIHLRRTMGRKILVGLSVLAGTWVLLLVPLPEAEIPGNGLAASGRRAFEWAQDSIWQELEGRFVQARGQGCDTLRPHATRAFETLKELIAATGRGQREPSDPLFEQMEETIFETGVSIAGCPDLFAEYLRLVTDARNSMKERSRSWDMNDRMTRETMYRILYGSRAAVEEVMLQLPPKDVPGLALGIEEPSETPFASILGVQIHSGDILVSRGGAPTSALIARGNDFPGNFSHVALVHVDAQTKRASIIESHIERGVAVATVEEYLRDTKLRVMVLRLRSDLPAMQADPHLPHRAAQASLDDARSRHIPYDFEMHYDEPSKLFCSEVASAAYNTVGVRLWMGISTISGTGLRSWLGAFGVKYFETQEPSDLEYDPQLRVVAEWRDPETLYQDHVDNAVTEAMLEGAERGERMCYDWYLLPLGRLMKLYSVAKNTMGDEGPVPEGMSAEAALRNRWYSQRHASARTLVMKKADAFAVSKGYRPPYWQLVQMAREALLEIPA